MATELGKAYVQIVPSAQGIKGKITDAISGESSSAGKSAGLNLVSSIKNVIVAAGIGKALMSSINEGAALQQSLGGIETLFKESANTVIANAKNAYKTAGMSANEYMETVTSFSASLLQSLDGDTVKAAKAADTALRDMSDNANKMGTSMELIQNAYQGFAKSNYTMLDNLKLGYGGTKSEMERLLADAEKLSGVKYDISNLSDVYEAIHVIQEEMGITGTTAEEASRTFSGSFAAMKAAAQNVLGNLALGEAIGPSFNALTETVFTFAENLLPMVGNILSSLPEVLEGTFLLAIRSMNLATKSMDSLLQNGVQLVTGLITGIVSALPYLVEAAFNIVAALGSAIVSTDWQTIASDIMMSLSSNMDIAAGEIFGTDGNLGQTIIDALNANLPSVLECGAEMALSLIDGIMGYLPNVIETTVAIIDTLLNTVLANIPNILISGGNLLLKLVEGIVKNLPEVVEATVKAVQTFLNTISSYLPSILQAGVQLILKLVNGMIDNLPQIVSAITKGISMLLQTIASKLPSILQSGIEIIGQLVAGLIQAIPKIVAAVPQIVAGLWDTITSVNWLSLGNNIVQGIANGIANGAGAIWNALKRAVSNAWNSVLSMLDVHSPSRLFAWLGEMIDKGLAGGITDNTGVITKAVGDAAKITTDSFDAEFTVRTSYVNDQSAKVARIDAREVIGGFDQWSKEFMLKLEALIFLLSNQDIKFVIGEREIGRILREMGVDVA